MKIFVFLTLIYLICLPRYADAYLDPGNGSYLFQMLIAGLLGASFFMKDGIKKIKAIFEKKAPKKESDHTA